MTEALTSLSGRIAVITGSGSGMGRAAAELMAAQGATVVVADLNVDSAHGTVASIEKGGRGAGLAVEYDASSVASAKDLMSLVDREFGKLNVLYNHVGSPGPGGLGITEEEWTRTVDINLKSAFFCTSFGEPLLRRASGQASVIFTASVSGLVGSLFSPIYSMCKGGIVAIGKALALSLAPDVRVNVIAPGVVDTPMLTQFFGRDPNADVTAGVQRFVDIGVPLNRVCTAEEVAQVALFLASDAAAYVTGVTIPVDGGYVAR
jgi:NAD(P)-dependent dehydrogenase (short-subunit alcohol dehydrogenase family)